MQCRGACGQFLTQASSQMTESLRKFQVREITQGSAEANKKSRPSDLSLGLRWLWIVEAIRA